MGRVARFFFEFLLKRERKERFSEDLEMGCGNSREKKDLASKNAKLEREAKSLRKELERTKSDSQMFENVFGNVFDISKSQVRQVKLLMDFRKEIETLRGAEKTKGVQNEHIANKLCMELMNSSSKLNGVIKSIFDEIKTDSDLTKKQFRAFLRFVFFRFNRYCYQQLILKGKHLQEKLEANDSADENLEDLQDEIETWTTNRNPPDQILDLIDQDLLKDVDEESINFKQFCSVIAKTFMAVRGESNLAPSWETVSKRFADTRKS